MKAGILTIMAALTALTALGGAWAQSGPPARERERDRSPYERGYYGDRRDDFDLNDDRWGRDVRFNDETPSFFPDGRRVVFASNRDGRDRELYVRDVERGGRSA